MDALAAIAGQCPRRDAPDRLGLVDIARLCYFSNGVTRVLRGMPFRAAACTGALYHVELYLACSDLVDLEAGLYHYGAHDNGLRQLRRGDVRARLVAATGQEPAVAEAPLLLALTSTWWRNSWKYQARAYRHAFWDSGTILANLLAAACGQGLPARVIVGFADAEVNRLLDVDPSYEATICLVAVGGGRGDQAPAPEARSTAPELGPLHLPTRALSAHEVDYPEIVQAHADSSLPSGAAVASWRAQQASSAPAAAPSDRDLTGEGIEWDPARETTAWDPAGESIESVILRRGSSRRFSHEAISLRQLQTMLAVATSPTPADAFVPCGLYLIINAVDGLTSGTYVFDRGSGQLEPLRPGEFRQEAAYLSLGQQLAGDAAVNAYWLVDLDRLDDRGYRAAQLSAAIEAGKLYLAAYALRLGATGLTFFDDDVTRFFSPHASGQSVMFLAALGHPARRR